MGFSAKRLLMGISVCAFAGAIAFAQSGTQGSTAKKPATATHSAAKPAGPGYDRALLTPSLLHAIAPAEFDVKFVTTKGDFTVHVTRAWAPKGADRFYNLARHHFFDGVALFRVVQTPHPFMAQFGISPYPAVAKAWENANIKDDPVTHHNVRGTITYAAESDPNTRSTQVFISYGDNSFLDSQRFAPFGEVTDGMDVVDKFYSGYGDAGAPDQGRMVSEGRAYTQKSFPNLDYIKTATVVMPAAGPKAGTAAKPGTSH